MFILRATPLNPSPDKETLLSRVRGLCPPGSTVALVAYDPEEQRDLLLDALDEEESMSAAFRERFSGDLDDAPDDVVREFVREHWGEDLLTIEYTSSDLGDGTWIDALAALAHDANLRLFDELNGADYKKWAD
jgi:hypothetical protein